MLYAEIQAAKVKELWWQKQNLMFTASGYGSKIPTRYMVQVENIWRRVYCCCYSNVGSLYIFVRGIEYSIHEYDLSEKLEVSE